MSPSRLFGFLLAAVMLATLSPVPQARAAIIVDQEADFPTSGFNDLGRQHWQSFQQAANNIAGAALRVTVFAATTANLTVTLWDGEPGGSSNQLATGTSGLPIGYLIGSDFWVDVFWSTVSVTPDTELFLEFTSDIGADIEVSVTNSSPYTRGEGYLDGGTFKGADFSFRTFADTEFGAAQVPEPGAFSLFGIGLAGMAIRKRMARR